MYMCVYIYIYIYIYIPAGARPIFTPVRENGSAPKGGRHSTIAFDSRRELCLSSADHLCSGSLMA